MLDTLPSWTQDKSTPRIYWNTSKSKTIAVNCIGNNTTRVVIKQSGASTKTEQIKYSEPTTKYVVFNFKRDIKKISAYYPQKPPFGFTLEVTLK